MGNSSRKSRYLTFMLSVLGLHALYVMVRRGESGHTERRRLTFLPRERIGSGLHLRSWGAFGYSASKPIVITVSLAIGPCTRYCDQKADLEIERGDFFFDTRLQFRADGNSLSGHRFFKVDSLMIG